MSLWLAGPCEWLRGTWVFWLWSSAILTYGYGDSISSLGCRGWTVGCPLDGRTTRGPSADALFILAPSALGQHGVCQANTVVTPCTYTHHIYAYLPAWTLLVSIQFYLKGPCLSLGGNLMEHRYSKNKLRKRSKLAIRHTKVKHLVPCGFGSATSYRSS